MRINVVPGDRLTSQHLAIWSQVLRDNPQLDSPYFRPEFVQTVAAVRNDVAVGIVEIGDRIVGFFPFQHGRWNVGRPVGTPLSDFHGAVVRPATSWNVEAMIRGCGLAGWRFDHLLADQQPFHCHHRATVASPYMDLSQGFDAYEQDLSGGGRQRFSSIRRKIRAAGRRVGPVRFEFHTLDSSALKQLIHWKTAQYERTQCMNVFAFSWVVDLFERIRDCQDKGFSGVLSALYFGDRLAAVHFGMRSGSVLHYWFPAYDTDLAPYSPGLICLVEIAKAAASLGIRRIDLGKGCEPYKMCLMSGATNVAEGDVLAGTLARMLSRVGHGADGLTRLPLLGAPVRWAAELSRPLRRQWKFR